MQFRTTAAYISGGICGHMWMPDALAGRPIQKDLRGPWGIMDRFTSPASFRDALLLLLMEEGGDFQDPAFTADTVIRIERWANDGAGKYRVHVWEREIGQLHQDLVNDAAYTSDFFSDEE
jgi:hypothetical protein